MCMSFLVALRSPCYNEVTCDRTFKGEVGQADGKVSYLQHQQGNKEGDGRSGPALVGLKPAISSLLLLM